MEKLLKFDVTSSGPVRNEFYFDSKLNNMIDLCVEDLRKSDLEGLGEFMLDFIVKKGEFRKKYLEKIKNCKDEKEIKECKEEMKEEIGEMGRKALKSRNN